MTIEDEVFDFVAKERGIKREKLKLSDWLLVDLGMDGDDAVEFFDKFEKQFEVDLTYLQEHWNEYFGPEGISGPWAIDVQQHSDFSSNGAWNRIPPCVVDSCCSRIRHPGGCDVRNRLNQ
jgi:acyl carrier protein